MGKRGQDKKPAELKIYEGNRGHRKINDKRPKPDVRIPVCPAWMKGYARTCWKRLAPELHRLGVLTYVDRDTLAAYCMAVAKLKYAEDHIVAEGEYHTNDKGNIFRHPASITQGEMMRQIKALGGLFGLNPSSRNDLIVEPASREKDDLLD